MIRKEKHKIGSLAKLAGKTTRTLRFYEEMGLIEPDCRSDSGYRLYSEDTLLRIQWIVQLQDMGFSLGDIKAFVSSLAQKTDAPSKMNHLARFYFERLKETREKIMRLQKLEESLVASLEMLSSCGGCKQTSEQHECRGCMEETKTQQNRLKIPDLIQPLLERGR